MAKITSYIISLLFMLVLPLTALIEALIKNIFVIPIFKYNFEGVRNVFLGRNF